MSLNITFQKDSKDEYVYSDLHLDLDKAFIPTGDSNLTRKTGNSDLRTDFDEHAIGNSLRNLFSTLPNQRLLLPDYGLDLRQFLFENANEYTARLIARKIINGIERYEPRVTVNNVDVIVDEENNRYDISLVVYIPTLKKNVLFTGIFKDSVFTL